ncbi:MAG: pyridoxamine 5'-phosphate oxidase family protein [Candidatus Taylorbacteria bacterium]|nr:pyridoxamine 5'-phosphate oxidase family protein [Candidatus Taylorbacteria bacterium]
MENPRKKIAEFLKGEKLAVVSTVGKDGAPESAVVAFAETKGLEIVFGTSNTSRKHANLQKDPRVSFAIGWSFTGKKTVQYEGVASELSGKEAEKMAKALIAKNPSAAKFHELPDQRYFIVKPTWIRYSDFKEGKNFEVRF